MALTVGQTTVVNTDLVCKEENITYPIVKNTSSLAF